MAVARVPPLSSLLWYKHVDGHQGMKDVVRKIPGNISILINENPLWEGVEERSFDGLGSIYSRTYHQAVSLNYGNTNLMKIIIRVLWV